MTRIEVEEFEKRYPQWENMSPLDTFKEGIEIGRQETLADEIEWLEKFRLNDLVDKGTIFYLDKIIKERIKKLEKIKT